MTNQSTIKIVNIKRSISKDKRFEQTLFASLWKKKEDKLRSQGWLPVSEIEEIKEEIVEDGKGKKTVVIEEAKEKVEEPVQEVKDYKDMSLEELKSECKAKGIKFHGASKEEKLIELLNENK